MSYSEVDMSSSTALHIGTRTRSRSDPFVFLISSSGSHLKQRNRGCFHFGIPGNKYTSHIAILLFTEDMYCAVKLCV